MLRNTFLKPAFETLTICWNSCLWTEMIQLVQQLNFLDFFFIYKRNNNLVKSFLEDCLLNFGCLTFGSKYFMLIQGENKFNKI